MELTTRLLLVLIAVGSSPVRPPKYPWLTVLISENGNWCSGINGPKGTVLAPMSCIETATKLNYLTGEVRTVSQTLSADNATSGFLWAFPEGPRLHLPYPHVACSGKDLTLIGITDTISSSKDLERFVIFCRASVSNKEIRCNDDTLDENLLPGSLVVAGSFGVGCRPNIVGILPETFEGSSGRVQEVSFKTQGIFMKVEKLRAKKRALGLRLKEANNMRFLYQFTQLYSNTV